MSEYLFKLVEKDRMGEISWGELKVPRGLRGLEKLVVEFLVREGGYAKYDELLSYVVGEGYSGKDLDDALNALSASVNVYVAETAIIVYRLNWTDTRVWGRLKLIDWANMTPLHGYITIIVKSQDSISEEWFEANPYTDFEASVPVEHETWALAVAPGVNAIYLNERYGRILLVKNPPI